MPHEGPLVARMEPIPEVPYGGTTQGRDFGDGGGGTVILRRRPKMDLEVACSPQVLKAVNFRAREEAHR